MNDSVNKSQWMISTCQSPVLMNVKLLTSSRYGFLDMAAVQLVSPVYWLKIGFASRNCKVPPPKCPVIYCLCHSIILLWVSESHREEILPSFAFFYWVYLFFITFILRLVCAESLWSHQSDLRHPHPQTHVLPLVVEGGFLYVFSRHC